MKSPTPTTLKQIRQFMGLAGYFRKFIPKFAIRTAPITKLTRANEPFVWTDEQEASRKYVIGHLTSKPLLSIFDPSLPTELHTDASSAPWDMELFLCKRKTGFLKLLDISVNVLPNTKRNITHTSSRPWLWLTL